MRRRKDLFLLSNEVLTHNCADEKPKTPSLLSDKYQCLVEEYYKSSSRDDYTSLCPVPIPNLLYVVDILEKLCLKIILDKNERDIRQGADAVEDEMREVLPGIVMRVTKPYPSSTLLGSEETSGRQQHNEVIIEEINIDIAFEENKKTYDAETVQNCISQIFPQQHRSKGFENFRKLLNYLPFYVSRIDPYVNVKEKIPFLYYLMKIRK